MMGSAQHVRNTAMQASASTKTTEYTIYTFQRSDEGDQTPWQRQETFPDQRQALRAAEHLYSTGAYCKVEVMRRISDASSQQVSDSKLKVFSSAEKPSLSARLLHLSAAAISAIRHLSRR